VPFRVGAKRNADLGGRRNGPPDIRARDVRGCHCVSLSARRSLWKIVRQRDLLRRATLALVPALEGFAVPADMLAGSADGDENTRRRSAVFEPAPQPAGHSRELARVEHMRLLLHDQRERPREHEIHLLLQAVPVNPSALPRLERQLIHPERLDAERAPKRDESLLAGEVNTRTTEALGDAFIVTYTPMQDRPV
jgi:hypothetical protein